jgi:hypothetical protein
MSNDQTEAEFEAQLQLEARLERGFARTIKTVLIGQPIPVAVAALLAVTWPMEICLLSNMPAGHRLDKLVEGSLEMLLQTEHYQGMSPAAYAQGQYFSDLHGVRDVEHGVKPPQPPADPNEAVQLACPRLWTLFQTAESVVLRGQLTGVALTALFMVLQKHVELVLTALAQRTARELQRNSARDARDRGRAARRDVPNEFLALAVQRFGGGVRGRDGRTLSLHEHLH